jgi:hypothetical protein
MMLGVDSVGRFGRLAMPGGRRHDQVVWRRQELPLDRETVNGIIELLMRIDAKLDRVIDDLEDGDAEEDES